MKAKRILSLTLAISVIACIFAGCSANKNDIQLLPTKNIKDKKWVIATDTDFKPFEYTDADGNLVGIDIEILEAIADDQDIDYELKPISWDGAVAACQRGEADGMIAGATITDKHKKDGWIFSDSYYTATQCIAVATGSNVSSIDDLRYAKVAVKMGTQGATYAESLKEEYNLDLTYFEDYTEMYQSISYGQCKACFDDTATIAYSIKNEGIALQIVEGTENEGMEYGFVILNKENQALIDSFNAGLKNIKNNGKYNEILSKYLG